MSVVCSLIGIGHALDGLENVQFVVAAVHWLIHGTVVLWLRSLLSSDKALEKIS